MTKHSAPEAAKATSHGAPAFGQESGRVGADAHECGLRQRFQPRIAEMRFSPITATLITSHSERT